MNITRESDSSTEVTLSILMNSEDEEPYLNRSYRRLAGRVRIPGFRPGKAPRSVVESHLGRAALVQEALEFMIPECLDTILKEQEIRAFTEPQLEVLDLEPVSFKAVVPLEPTVDLGEFRSIRLQAPEVEVGDDDVNTVLESLRFESAPWEPAERPVAFGDLVTLNVRGTVGGQETINDEAVDYIPELEKEFPVPGFSVYLEGMTEGQEKEFTLPIPEESLPENSTATDCQFTVEVLSIKVKQLPELDDEFAKGVRDGFESMEALSEHVRQRLTEDAEATALRELERNSLEEVKKLATVQASDIIFQREMESMREDHERTLRNQRLDMDTYLRYTGQTVQEFQDQLRPQAEDRLTTFLVLRKLAEQEELEIESDEIDAEIDRLMENSAEETAEGLRRMLSTDESRDSISTSLLNRKVMARLVELVSSEEPESADGGDESQPESVAEVESPAASPESADGGDESQPESVAEVESPAASEEANASDDSEDSDTGEQSNG